MSIHNNQEIERYYFDQFREHYALPEGRVEYSDKPDIIIHGGSKIGIELARLYISEGTDTSSEQRQRPLRGDVLNQAQALYKIKGGKPVALSVDFCPEQPILEIQPLIESFVELIKKIAIQKPGLVNPVLFRHIPQVRSIYNHGLRMNAQWQSIQCLDVPVLSVERVRELVRVKEIKAKKYQPCEAYWLLLIVDMMDFAQDQELHWPTEATLGTTNFERIIIYKPQIPQILEILA